MTEDRTYIWLAPIGFIGLIYGIWQIIYLSGIKLDGTGITTRDGGKAIANQGVINKKLFLMFLEIQSC